MSLYTTYRPSTLDEVAGNEDIKSRIQEFIDDPDSMPHTIMFSGDSGTGKTTLARIIASELGAEHKEYNCADIRGLDDFREIVKTMTLKPIGGGWRVIVLDEVHQLPNATQDLLLKPLEDGTSSTIIILCTTNPEKLKKTVRTRPVTFTCENLEEDDMRSLLRRVCRAEEIKLKKSIVSALITASNGSGRQCLTILESIVGLSTELMLKKIAAHSTGEYPEEVIILCRALIAGKPWKTIAALVKKVEGEPETIRRQVLGYSVSCLPNMGAKAYKIADAFRDNYFDTGKSGVMLSAFEACHG